MGQQDEAGHLIGENPDPDTCKTQRQHTGADPCHGSTYDRYADQCRKQRIFNISGTAQTAAVDDLGDLEQYDDGNKAADHHTKIQYSIFLEEQGE